MKNEIQTGTKVLIEATVEFHDTRIDKYAVKTKNGDHVYFVASDLTVCETAQQIDLNNFAIDITDPVNAELLPGFKEWVRDQKPGNVIQGSWRHPYYGMQYGKTAVWYDSEKNVCEKLLTTLPDLQKQHPGVFNQSDSEPTPSFKAGQEVEFKNGHGEWERGKYLATATKGQHCIEMADCFRFSHDIRPIPAQPTVESELSDWLEKTDLGERTGHMYSWLMAWHQKHSGRVEVSDREILEYWRSRPSYSTEGVIKTVQHFMTRKEQRG